MERIDNSLPPYSFVVVIDEPGYGYAAPCASYHEAEREARKLAKQGFKVAIRRINKNSALPAQS